MLAAFDQSSPSVACLKSIARAKIHWHWHQWVTIHDHTTPAPSSQGVDRPLRPFQKVSLATSSRCAGRPLRPLQRISLATSMVAALEGYANHLKNGRCKEKHRNQQPTTKGYANLLENGRCEEKHRKQSPEAWYSLVNLPGGLSSLARRSGCVRVIRCQGKPPLSNNPLQGKASSPTHPRLGMASLIASAALCLPTRRRFVS
jgi:hypothetical protein